MIFYQKKYSRTDSSDDPGEGHPMTLDKVIR